MKNRGTAKFGNMETPEKSCMNITVCFAVPGK